MLDISKSFKLETLSIQNFFTGSSIGYYIPIYQRKYSWSEDNIDQLMMDLCFGVNSFLEDVNALHFMGTLILIEAQENDRDIGNLNQRGLPDLIRKVIDGQQRISTIAIVSCNLYQRLHFLKQNLPSSSDFVDLIVSISSWQKNLENVFSFDLGRGKPSRKPIIIRSESDEWIETDSYQTPYNSEVTKYIASFIKSIDQNPAHPSLPDHQQYESLKEIVETINIWLDRVINAHINNEEDYFPSAWEIIHNISEQQLWQYPRPSIVRIVDNRSNPMNPIENQICSIIQLMAFCYYLMRRCGFTVITPNIEDRAFDMFQSLNATGTPLTSIETFKPLVVNAADTNPNGYVGSMFEENFDKVDDLFSRAKTASHKNRLTNEYLTAFALIYDGSKLPSQFSRQRMWLTKNFGEQSNLQEKENFVGYMRDLAVYWNNIVNFDPKRNSNLPLIEDNNIRISDHKEAALCVLYLKDAGHTMANTVLGRFYGQIVRKIPGAESEFIQACKAVAAFFTLWRSALPNKGLDEIYRKLLSNHICWEKGDANLTSVYLKDHLRKILVNKNIGTQQEWFIKARQDLRYDIVKTVCKFALFVAAHDTKVDSSNPGLMKIALPKTAPHLTPELWKSPDFKSIEHVAPQKHDLNSTWDQNIYSNGDYQRIGNLILLPVDINAIIGAKPWIEKLIYYQFLSLTDVESQKKLKEEATRYGITLSEKKVLEPLQKAGHQNHITSVVNIGVSGNWDQKLIEQRTERICEILWQRMISWLT